MQTQIFEDSTRIARRWLILVVLAAAGLAVGCGDEDGSNNNGPGNTGEHEFTLSPAQSCDEIRDRIVDSTTEEALRYRYQYAGMEDDAAGGEPSAEEGNDSSESPDDYTETNVQEEGVDEDDIIKTDGDFIYAVHESELLILDSWPAEETSIVSRYDLSQDGTASDNGHLWARSMFLKGDRVAVFSQFYDQTQWTRITILDVSDRSAPVLEDVVELEGYFQTGRMTDGEMYLVSQGQFQHTLDVWGIAYSADHDLPESDWEDSEAEVQQKVDDARPLVRQIVEQELADKTISELMPRRRTFESDGSENTEAMYACDELYLPQQNAGLGVLHVSHLDMDDPTEITSTGLMAHGWNVYASTDNLYVAMSSRAWWWGWGWMGAQDNESHIHKFSLDGDDERPVYRASGRVDGWILNQFSMDEHDGYLRVATTDNRWDWNTTTGEREVDGGNHVIVLEESGGQFKERGSVRDMAPGERIFSTRMMGDKGYVVTFEQVDPLFTLDLSDPHDPQLMGELKVNGFSSYIHPLGDDHLMTIGQDADDQGQVTGVQLQIFDVSDMTDPQRVHQEVLSTGGWSSWSEAMWDHHAFTYHPEREVLAFPINIHEWDENNGENFTGLLVYSANAADGFSEIGRVDHGDFTSDGQSQWWTSVRRSVFIEDYVYSFGALGLKVNDLLAPENERASVQF
ncbi:MAG: beta-propeller domain-containing protein [Persicimonas sp.]